MAPGLGSKGNQTWEAGKRKLGISCSCFTEQVLPKCSPTTAGEAAAAGSISRDG